MVVLLQSGIRLVSNEYIVRTAAIIDFTWRYDVELSVYQRMLYNSFPADRHQCKRSIEIICPSFIRIVQSLYNDCLSECTDTGMLCAVLC